MTGADTATEDSDARWAASHFWTHDVARKTQGSMAADLIQFMLAVFQTAGPGKCNASQDLHGIYQYLIAVRMHFPSDYFPMGGFYDFLAARMKPDSPRPHGALLILMAGCISFLAPKLIQLVAFREFSLDPRDAQWQTFMNLPIFVILIIPIQLGILSFIRGKSIRPIYRSLLVLSPVLVFAIPKLVVAVVKPVSAKACFYERMKLPLSPDAAGLKAWYSHSPGASVFMFSFSTIPEFTEALLASGHFTLIEEPSMSDPELGAYYELPIGGLSIPKGWPKPKTWENLKVFTSNETNDFCYILTDSSKCRVFILVGDT